MAKREIAYKIADPLMRWSFFLYLVVASPFFFFPQVKTIWVALPSFIFIFYYFLLSQESKINSSLDLIIFVFALQLFINLLIIPEIESSLPKIMGAFYGLLVFYGLIAFTRTKKIAFIFLVLFLITGTLLSLVGIMGMAWSAETFFVRLVNFFARIVPRFSYKIPGAEGGINPNPLGGSLLLFLPLGFYLLMSYLDKNQLNFPFKLHKGLFLFALFSVYSMATALFLTQSVGSWLGLILTACIFLLLRGSWKRRAIIAATIFILIFIFIHNWSNLRKVQLINDFFHSKMSSRLFFWNLGLSLIKEHPLTGIGMNRVRLRPDVGYETAHLHNHLIHTAAEMGLPALLAYLAMLIIASYLCYKIYQGAKDGWMKGAALGLGAGQMAHFFYGLTDSIPFGAKPGIFFWISLALINSLYNLSLKGEEQIGPNSS